MADWPPATPALCGNRSAPCPAAPLAMRPGRLSIGDSPLGTPQAARQIGAHPAAHPVATAKCRGTRLRLAAVPATYPVAAQASADLSEPSSLRLTAVAQGGFDKTPPRR